VNSLVVVAMVDGVVTVAGADGVVHSLSSSGQSSRPSHQDVALIQMLLVGHRTVSGGQGLQIQPHEGVSTLCRPCKQEEIGFICFYFFSITAVALNCGRMSMP
jgi:hypothetical protein